MKDKENRALVLKEFEVWRARPTPHTVVLAFMHCTLFYTYALSV
jgi:hypothetical protein